MNKNINIIIDPDGKKLVLINDVKFKSRRTLNWTTVEEILKEYIGKYFEIQETAEHVYIGSDFPDEFCHSLDTKSLQGANEKAKANVSIDVVCGHGNIYVPADWHVTTNIDTVCGNASFLGNSEPNGEDKLLVNGDVVFGDLRIYYV